jgi:hypothetical protein
MNLESTNAAMMIIVTKEYGYFGIDPLGDTWIEAERVHDLWHGRKKIPAVRSRSCDGKIEIWFVSLDWLIGLYPTEKWLQTARDVLKGRMEKDGFEADDE